ncbi:hypothetical protein OG404_09265 [Streptomyces griseoaurantiacus]|uniref:hypothetical protein n=1 Tax=Streptomyces griseoaurantiacus TaxID=68213 RepID=UPI00352C0EBB
MTKDKRRKTAIREMQRATGTRYTRLAREVVVPLAGQTFRLADLLAECATLPHASVEWDFPERYAPAVFDSSLIGTAVPYGTVLELAGILAQVGPGGSISLESVSPLAQAIVVCRKRRFQLVLTQDMVNELCQKPECPNSSDSWAFTHCRDHLAECGTRDLVSMARDWGHGRREEFDENPAVVGGSTDVDPLIKAAVASVSFEPVRDALLDACFGDPNLFDDMYWDASQSLAVQHAFERERLRIYEVAQAEVRRIHKVTGSCSLCGKRLFAWNPSIPPTRCPACAPPRAAELSSAAFT